MGTIQIVGSTLAKQLPQIKQAVSTETRQLPEFLYHFTSEECADKIIRSGKLLAQNDGGAFDRAGVFMVDLENFLKIGLNHFGVMENISLLIFLMDYLVKLQNLAKNSLVLECHGVNFVKMLL